MLIRLASVWFFVVLAGPSAAQDSESFLDDDFPYIAVNRPVAAAFADFTRLTGIPAVLSPEVRGAVSVRNADGDVRSFLNSVAAQNTLIWWRDGNTLRLDSAAAVGTDLLPLNNVSDAAILARLEELDLVQPKFTIRSTADGTMLRVSGPAAYREAVRDVVESLTRPADPEVRTAPQVFRGTRGN